MKRFAFLIAPLAAVLAGCLSVAAIEAGTPVTLTAVQIAATQNGVRTALKDPQSAQFRAPFNAVQTKTGGIVVCSYVNAKNSYGGYTGDKPFMGMLVGGAFAGVYIGGGDDEVLAVKQVCNQHGITL